MGRLSVDLPTLDQLSATAAETTPDRTAFVDDTGASLTWREFEERSRRAASAFAGRVRQGDRVALLSEATVDTTVAWNGALKAGAIVSYVHTRAAPETVRFSIEQLRPEVLVVHEDRAGFVAESVRDDLDASPEVVVVGGAPRSYEQSLETLLANAAPTRPDVLRSADDIAAVVWTSGTTGRPKGWCHTHRSIMLKALSWDVPNATTRLSAAPTAMMAWYSHVVPVMNAAETVVFLSEWDPERWVAAVEEHGVTHASLVPTLWRSVLEVELDRYDLSSLETIAFVGERMDRTTLERLREAVCSNVVNKYAATEALISRIHVDEMVGERIESVGKPADMARVRIIEPGGDSGETLPPGEVGEIVVKSPDCPVWAWGQSERLADAFRDGWWYSGDLGYTDEEGYLFLKGRKDFMIKSKGVKVFPTPVEERLTDHPRVDEAVVVGVDDEEFGQKVTAVVRSEVGVTAEALDEWCLDGDGVARFERPRAYLVVDGALPWTPTQKLDRKTVREWVETDDPTHGRFERI